MLEFILIFVLVIFIAWLRTRIYYVKIYHNEIVFKKGILGDVDLTLCQRARLFRDYPTHHLWKGLEWWARRALQGSRRSHLRPGW